MYKTLTKKIKKKTWKREIAVSLLIFLGYLAVTGGVAALEILVVPCFFFVYMAFGMEAVAKQILPKFQEDVDYNLGDRHVPNEVVDTGRDYTFNFGDDRRFSYSSDELSRK